MFNPTLIVIETFIRDIRAMYGRTYTNLEPTYPGILSFAAQLALETIATSDAVYHDVNHTIMVTLVGQEILRGSMAPYHVARSKLFARERGAKATMIHLDTAHIEANIEHTRFPRMSDTSQLTIFRA